MSSYRIALVRFSKNGRRYPVNCTAFDPGNRVIVRMGAQASPLQRAEVVEITYNYKPCKNTVVCMEEDAEAYGSGAAGVENADCLDRFLSLLHWERYSTLRRDGFGAVKIVACDEWPVAYEYGSQPRIYSSGKLWGPNTVILVGPQGAGFYPCGNMSCTEIVDGKLVLDGSKMVRGLGKEGLAGSENPYRRAAKIGESILRLDMDPPDYPG